MNIDNLSWVLAFGSLIGGQLVINKNKSGYVIWVIVNLLWITYFVYKDIYSSAFLFLVYMIQSIYGYIKWKRNEK